MIKNLSLLVRKFRIRWGAMATLGLVNLVIELASTLDEPLRRLPKLISQPEQMRALNKTERLQISAITSKSKGTGKGTALSLSISDSQPSYQSFPCPPYPQ